MKLVITGRVPSKKNSRISTRSGRSFPSKAYVDWEKNAWQQVKGSKRIEGRVSVTMNFFMPDRRSTDLDNKAASILDLLKDQYHRVDRKQVLKEARIIEDDSWQVVPHIVLTGELDAKNPRCEVTIKPMV